jgi:hypothetical protein
VLFFSRSSGNPRFGVDWLNDALFQLFGKSGNGTKPCDHEIGKGGAGIKRARRSASLEGVVEVAGRKRVACTHRGKRLFLGLWGASICAILGALCCLTIVGIPFGIKYFKFIKYIFLPSNLAVATRPRQKHLALNFFFAIFGGLYARYLSAFVQTIFSWLPFTKGLAFYLHNIRDYFVSPFDSEFCEYGNYSSTRDTRYDYNLLQRKKVQFKPNYLVYMQIGLFNIQLK